MVIAHTDALAAVDAALIDDVRSAAADTDGFCRAAFQAIGACLTIQGEAAILRDGFGVVAFIAMTPLITIQLLGFKAIVSNKVKEKIAMKRILDDDDEQIIDFI